MSRRIEKLKESPCYQCGCRKKCQIKINKNPVIGVLRDNIFGDADFDYHKCGIWIALNAPEMIEVETW